jgi:hypothetical protein
MSLKQNVAIVMAIAVLSVSAVAAITIPQIANAAQSCNQPGGVVAACVNADVSKNNICVGVISRSDRCTQ